VRNAHSVGGHLSGNLPGEDLTANDEPVQDEVEQDHEDGPHRLRGGGGGGPKPKGGSDGRHGHVERRVTREDRGAGGCCARGEEGGDLKAQQDEVSAKQKVLELVRA